MCIFNASNKKLQIKAVTLLLLYTITLLIVFLEGCKSPSKSRIVNIGKLASLGKPPASEVLWSPVNQNEILVNSGYIDFMGGEIYILNLQTGEKQILAKAEYGQLGIRTWLPDGKSIILAANKDTEAFEQGGVWEVSLDENKFTFLQAEIDKMIWGPNKQSLTIEKTLKTESGQEKTDLIWMDKATNQETVVFETEVGQTILGFSWSPDGRQLVFSMGTVQPMGKFDIYVLDIPSGKLNQITKQDDNTYPVWSPTNQLIAYRKKMYDENRQVYSLHLIDSTGSCDIKLIESDYLLSPTWSPDGDFLAFIEPNADGIFAVNIREFLASDYKKWCQ